MQQEQETAEELCNRLNFTADDWLYGNHTKLRLLPLAISATVYQQTPYEAFKIIFNTKVAEYEARHKRLIKQNVAKRNPEEKEKLHEMSEAIKQITDFLKT